TPRDAEKAEGEAGGRRLRLKDVPPREAAAGLVDGSPVRRAEAPGDQHEQSEEDEHADADADPRSLRRLTHPLQVRHQVADRLVVLALVERAWRDLLEAGEAMRRLGRIVLVLDLDEAGAPLPLQLPERVRHCDVGEGEVVPAGRPRVV